MRLYAPWEKAFNKISTPFEHFIHAQTTTGLILIFMTILALIFANTPFSEAYAHFFHMKIDFNVGDWKLSHTFHHWINDGLMAIFFFIIGLAIRTRLYRFLNRAEDRYLLKIPGYKLAKETVQQFFGKNRSFFKEVVLVDIFNSGALMTGFITDDQGEIIGLTFSFLF